MIRKRAELLKKRFEAEFPQEPEFGNGDFNGFTFPRTPVISNRDPHKIVLYQWGLLPAWAKDDTFRANTLNARIETLAEKASFKNYISNRCLVLADGFYEWEWLDEKGKKKQKYRITLPDESPFAFAGLYSTWTDRSSGEMIDTYTIVTTKANEMMSRIHNTKQRMPVILTPLNERQWLSGEDIKAFEVCDPELHAAAV